MTRTLSRRDFLKLIALGSTALAARPLASSPKITRDASAPNIFLFIFDAWSARHLSLHGYPRETMPNLTRFAERAFVFHNHYSAGNYTVPGTASLLTGVHPWTHRAVQLTAGGVAPALRGENLFAALGRSLDTFGYSQNPYADIFLYQFQDRLDTYLPHEQFNLERRLHSSLPVFDSDAQMAFSSLENNIFRDGKGNYGSLYAGMASRLAGVGRSVVFRKKYSKKYPNGLPVAGGGTFLLEKVVNGAIGELERFDSPTLAYFHFFPPHQPYAPKSGYEELFHDDWKPPRKPIHPLSLERFSEEETLRARLRYDQYLAAWDSEFARLLGYLEASGLLDTSIVVLTSDHGELFERGEIEHITSLLADPVVHIPLLVSLPGQTQRKDIRAFTSSVDVLPTLAHLVGAEPPAWAEGTLLPGLGGKEDDERSVYSIEAKTSSSFSAFEKLSISIAKRRHRLIYYQYPRHSGFELYDMDNDPEEMNDLYPSSPALAEELKREALQKIEEFNAPYRSP